MSIPSASGKARLDAQRELARLRAQVAQAKAQLEQLQAEAARIQGRFGPGRTLQAVNQRLVLATLRAQVEAEEVARVAQQATQSAREQAQAEHLQHHAQLSEANAQLVLAAIGAQELQAAAQQAQRRQTELLAMVAHELRHPLAPIRNAAAVLGRIPEPPPVLARMQAIIEKQVAHLARLVGDLLDTAGAQSGQLRIELRRMDLAGVIEDAVEASRPAMDSRMQRFSCPGLPASLPMNGDPGRLAQVFRNLLDNASKYTPIAGEIVLSVQQVESTVVVVVTDTGIGITPEALPRVFDPFVQDPHATAFNGVGLGLGLTVVRELVEAHGGTVLAASEGAGLGSSFVVRLPLDAGG